MSVCRASRLCGLVGMLDEAVRFVCERAYPGDPTGRIEVSLEPTEGGSCVTA